MHALQTMRKCVNPFRNGRGSVKTGIDRIDVRTITELYCNQKVAIRVDLEILANSNEDLQKIFDVVKSTREQKGLDMNVKKTKTMVICNKNQS